MNGFRVSIIAGAMLFIHLAEAKPKSQSPDNLPCNPGTHRVRAHPRRSFIKADGTQVRATFVESYCKPNPVGFSVWKDRLRAGRPSNWPWRSERNHVWNVEEQERVLDAIAELPDVLRSLTVNGIYRFEKHAGYPKNPAAGQSQSIVLYDSAFSSDENLSRILAHELAHELYRQLPGTEKADYAKDAQWIVFRNSVTGRDQLIPLREGFVEEDGSESIDEDFSNNLEYFLFERAALRTKSPKVEAWFVRKFGGKLVLPKGDAK